MSTDDVPDDVELWMSFKQMSEVVRARVLHEVLRHTGLSESELTVLVHLQDAGGELRQNALVTACGWDRSRLSHLLSRMQDRGYLTRRRLRNGVLVVLGDGGTAALGATRGPLGVAVAEHVTPRLDDGLRAAMRAIIEALA